MDKTYVHLTRHGAATAVLTIERPERRNALNIAIKREFERYLEDLANEPDLRTIIITGAGGYFVAGTDIAEMVDLSPQDHAREGTGRIFNVLRGSDKILVAAVEGYALGGGFELALGCDLIFAARGARFALPEIRVGIMPGGGGTQRLSQIAGRYKAMRLILSGEALRAEDADVLGLVSELVDDGEALNCAIAFADQIAARPPLAVHAAKQAVKAALDVPMADGFAAERRLFEDLFASEDQAEGMRAFLEKREPRYVGR
jgi:enoyl-CoA hydratase